MKESAKSIQLKGKGAALQVSFSEALPSIAEVLRTLRDAGDMVSGVPLVFDFGALDVSRDWVIRLMIDVIGPMGLSVKGWHAASEVGAEALSSLGLSTDAESRPVMADSTTAILWNPLRSGQLLQHDGDIILVGNLHDGAEIQATGSICVLGQLKGVVHAGCGGDNSMSVIACSYMANHIRIGTMVSTTRDPAECSWWGKAVSVSLKGGVFVARELKLDRAGD